jgi:hypothetical protein
MKSKILSTALLLLFFTTAFAQEQKAPPLSSPAHISGLISSDNRYPSKQSKGYISYEEVLQEYEDFDGSPFLHGKEITVDLLKSDGTVLPGVRILYDLYNFEVIVKETSKEDVILDKTYYTGFSYNNNGQVELYERVFEGQVKYFKVLYKNEDFSFLSNQKIRITDGGTYIPGNELPKRKFQAINSHYIVTKKTIDEVSLKNEKLINYLPAKYKSKVSSIKKKLKIKKLKKEEDYLRVMGAF